MICTTVLIQISLMQIHAVRIWYVIQSDILHGLANKAPGVIFIIIDAFILFGVCAIETIENYGLRGGNFTPCTVYQPKHSVSPMSLPTISSVSCLCYWNDKCIEAFVNWKYVWSYDSLVAIITLISLSPQILCLVLNWITSMQLLQVTTINPQQNAD